uniref:Uncharacterized protein n=1 Tax=Brassica oleracea var. oleracea TaxID=109376 RepID=A0A0D3D872_BRAOL
MYLSDLGVRLLHCLFLLSLVLIMILTSMCIILSPPIRIRMGIVSSVINHFNHSPWNLCILLISSSL